MIIHDRAWEFFNAPSLETAEGLLDAYKVSVPFRELMRVGQSVHINAFSDSEPSPKRTKRAKSGSAPYGGNPGNTGNTTDKLIKKLHTLSRLDVLHDLHDEGIMPMPIIKFVLADADLPSQEDYEAVVRACQDGRSNITHLFSTMMGISIPRKRKRTSTKGATSSVSLHESLQQDHQLYEVVSKWQQRQKLELVMDGIVTVPSNAIMDDDSEQVKRKFVQSLFMNAFIMLLLGRYDAVSRLPYTKLTMSDRPPSAVKSIVFLYGVFQWMDIGGWKKHIDKLIAHMEQLMIPYSRRIIVKYMQPKEIMPYSNRFVVNEPQRVLFVDGVSVPIHSPKPINSSIGSIGPFNTNSQLFDYYELSFGVTYTKKHLQTIFGIFNALSNKEQQKRTSFMRRVMDVNSFRDTYKADVALRRNAIYITFDRLAYAYYVIRGSAENREHHGIFYSVIGPRKVELLTKRAS